MKRIAPRRHTELAVVVIILAVLLVAFGLYTARGMFAKKDGSKPGTGAPTDPALKAAAAAEAAGRPADALKAARDALGSKNEARALGELGDAGAKQAWTAILANAAYSANERAEAAARIGELLAAGASPDLAGAIAAYTRAVDQFPGTPWGDWAAMALADAHIRNRHPERAKAVLTQYAVKAKDPAAIQDKLGDVNVAVLFSPLQTDVPKTIWYTVEQGDVLAKIARKFNTTVDLLAEANNIDDPHLLQIGDRLKVVDDTFRIVIDKSENTLSLFCHDTLIKKYPVGTGEFDKTPEGEFTIASKDIDPPWGGIPYGDPRNVLGTRWMRITNADKTLVGYGIHGTWQPETIGKHSSQGCVRMLNEDVEELFKIVTTGTPVRIVP
jgi:lipoprotein-anchoring transpeptidase ErfK/SrfK